ncbi:hypothetical protein BST43_02065 [Mycobacteroides saopaulense]|uniref:HTH tetR-type domain-containing protein n=1 Tax=Mycobacteroides saopaulense TaxID=1578165 RepID=A0A1X0JCE8_9MYCO|nr:TetR/AcrR family transcriptional regulator [Mycobacteroides saopaulense]ORB60360.1 hypothetical protein BST43_02065 [Mycobacteroides saopaulense]
MQELEVKTQMAGDGTTHISQVDRRQATMKRLLDATIESILDIGYAATTVRSVADRAGVSLGARSHFFPRRIDMVIAALDQLCADRLAAARASVDGMPTGEEGRLQHLLDLMWHDYTSRNFVVGIKLWVAAADDPELRTHLVTSTQALNASLQELYAYSIDADLLRIPDLLSRITMVHHLLSGYAFNHAFAPDEQSKGTLDWPVLRADLERLVRG